MWWFLLLFVYLLFPNLLASFVSSSPLMNGRFMPLWVFRLAKLDADPDALEKQWKVRCIFMSLL